MPVLPTLRGREVVAVFEGLGWSIARQQQGSHIIMAKEGCAGSPGIGQSPNFLSDYSQS